MSVSLCLSFCVLVSVFGVFSLSPVLLLLILKKKKKSLNELDKTAAFTFHRSF